jgi:hypothetical protein
MSADLPPDVRDRAVCRNCIRPIVLVAGVGWLHDELPKYAHQPITCTVPVPSDPSKRSEQ